MSTNSTKNTKPDNELTREEALTALREYRQLYRNLVEKTTDLITRVDRLGYFVYVNHAAHEIYGIPPEECIGKRAFDFLFPEDRESTITAFNSWLATNAETLKYENRQLGKDGRIHIMTWVICAERDDKGEITGFVSTGRDITESKRTQHELLKNEALLRTALENFPLIFYMIDRNGIFRLSVGAGLKGLGLEQNQVVGLSAFDIYKDFPEIITAVKSALAGQRSTFETTVSGSSYFNVCIPFSPASGWFDGIVAVALDITEQIRANDVLQNVQKLESLGILAGGIAHDFNNLMGGILGYIDLAKRCSTDNEVTEYLERALGSISRARALTMQLLTFAKGGAPIQTIGSLIPVIQQATQFSLSGSSVSCSFDIPTTLYHCNFDKNQIGQVIDNIVINAQHAMPTGGAIQVTARNITLHEREHLILKKGNYVKISFKDQGIGIPLELQSRIFDPFFTTKDKGHGLGLATCYSIIKRHGGAIEVESEPGKGTTFHIYLPASNEKGEAVAASAPTTHKGSGTIFLMDDEEIMLDVIAQMLRSLGYTPVCTKNGTETLKLFNEEIAAGRPVAGMILDLTIPGGMGGKEAISAIRKIHATIPVIVASGYADDPVMQDPTSFGFTASISKPILLSTLSEVLSKHLPMQTN